MCRTTMTRSIVMISHSSPQASAHPGRSVIAKAAVPNSVQATPHRLSQNRSRRALRAVTGSLPVRITTTVQSVTREVRVVRLGFPDRRLPGSSRGKRLPFTVSLGRVNPFDTGTGVRLRSVGRTWRRPCVKGMRARDPGRSPRTAARSSCTPGCPWGTSRRSSRVRCRRAPACWSWGAARAVTRGRGRGRGGRGRGGGGGGGRPGRARAGGGGAGAGAPARAAAGAGGGGRGRGRAGGRGGGRAGGAWGGGGRGAGGARAAGGGRGP